MDNDLLTKWCNAIFAGETEYREALTEIQELRDTLADDRDDPEAICAADSAVTAADGALKDALKSVAELAEALAKAQADLAEAGKAFAALGM